MITVLKPKDLTLGEDKAMPCFEDMSNGEPMSETPLARGAKQHGDNPVNSERPKQDSHESFVDGPFGGAKSA